MYYLETNSLYTLANLLKDLAQNKNIYTSALSMIEIISGINEQNFTRRRNIIRKVLNSSIYINWERPEAIFLESFGLINNEDKAFMRELKSLCWTIAKSNTLLDMKYMVKQNKLNEVLEFCFTYDRYSSSNFSNSFSKHSRLFKEKVAYNDGLDFYKISYKDTSMRKKFLEFTIEHFAKGLSTCEILNKNKKDANEIAMHYKGNVNYHLEASCYYAIFRQTKREFTARNDYFDLLHFLYIGGKVDTKIVSDDKLVVNICSTLWPEKIVNSNYFKQN